jgi:glutathione S-transferase
VRTSAVAVKIARYNSLRMYTLIYWPFLQGRGEFVRLVLEDANVPYLDQAREPIDEGGGVPAVTKYLYGQGEGMPGFAPPFLIDGESRLAQMPAVCALLGERHGLAPLDEVLRMRAMQMQLTIGDAVDAVHDTHHPVSTGLTYEQQKDEAQVAAKSFREERLGKWLGFFETVLIQNNTGVLVGDAITYPDLALFQLVEGLRYAFPIALAPALVSAPAIAALHQTVRTRPRIAAYLASERRIAFNEDGIFRHYPELDSA